MHIVNKRHSATSHRGLPWPAVRVIEGEMVARRRGRRDTFATAAVRLAQEYFTATRVVHHAGASRPGDGVKPLIFRRHV